MKNAIVFHKIYGFFFQKSQFSPNRRLNAGVCGETAVNGNDNAVYKAGCIVIAEPEQGTGEIVGRTEAAHGSMSEDLFGTGRVGAVSIEKECFVLLGDEEAGSDCVNANANLGEVNGEPLSEVGNSSLGTGVCGNLRQGTEAVHAGNVDDGRAGLLCHIACKYLRGDQGAE